MSITHSPDSVNGRSASSPPPTSPPASAPACPRCRGERVLWPVDGVPAPVCPWCDDIAFEADAGHADPDAPPCPDCGAGGTYWFRDVVTAEPLVLVCEACAGADGCDCDHDADTVCEPTPLAPKEGGASHG